MSHSVVLSDRTSTYLFGETQFNPSLTVSKACLPQTSSVEYVHFREWQQRLLSLPGQSPRSDPGHPTLGVLRALPLGPRCWLFSRPSVHLPAHHPSRWRIRHPQLALAPFSAVLAGGSLRPLLRRTSRRTRSPPGMDVRDRGQAWPAPLEPTLDLAP